MLVMGGYYSIVKLQTAAVATGNGTAVSTLTASGGAFSTLTCQVTGITTATITWEGTVDGATWVALAFTNLTNNTAASTATADGIHRATVTGLLSVRARISAWTSGTIHVTGALCSRG
jgi:hypothetical protein